MSQPASLHQRNRTGPSVLLLGAGLVAPPVVDYLAGPSPLGANVSVASESLGAATVLAARAARASPLLLDVNDDDALDAAVGVVEYTASRPAFYYDSALTLRVLIFI